MTNPPHGKNGSDTLPAAGTGEAATGVPWSARAHADPVDSWERRYLWPLEGLRTALNHIQGDHHAEADPGTKAAIGLRWLRPVFIQYLSALHVAIEGYRALGLHDPAVEAVLPDLEPELRTLHAAVSQFVLPEQFRTALSGFYGPRGSTADRRFSQTSVLAAALEDLALDAGIKAGRYAVADDSTAVGKADANGRAERGTSPASSRGRRMRKGTPQRR